MRGVIKTDPRSLDYGSFPDNGHTGNPINTPQDYNPSYENPQNEPLILGKPYTLCGRHLTASPLTKGTAHIALSPLERVKP